VHLTLRFGSRQPAGVKNPRWVLYRKAAGSSFVQPDRACEGGLGFLRDVTNQFKGRYKSVKNLLRTHRSRLLALGQGHNGENYRSLAGLAPLLCIPKVQPGYFIVPRLLRIKPLLFVAEYYEGRGALLSWAPALSGVRLILCARKDGQFCSCGRHVS
jgi:hypothetical protein